MNTVKVNVAKLKETVIANREKHNNEFIEAMIGYRTDCIRLMKENLMQAEADKHFVTYLDIKQPVSYIKDYDRVISMLKWTEDTIIELTASEFDHYVNDNWQWQESFKSINSMYMSKK